MHAMTFYIIWRGYFFHFSISDFGLFGFMAAGGFPTYDDHGILCVLFFSSFSSFD